MDLRIFLRPSYETLISSQELSRRRWEDLCANLTFSPKRNIVDVLGDAPFMASMDPCPVHF